MAVKVLSVWNTEDGKRKYEYELPEWYKENQERVEP